MPAVFSRNSLLQKKSFRFVATLVKLSLVCVGGMLLTQCASPKNIVYFQGIEGSVDTSQIAAPYNPLIKPRDVLSIQVSSLNPESAAIFNPNATVAGATSTGTALPAMVGYLVSSTGTITMPIVGDIMVGGLTVEQSSAVIREKLVKHLKEPTVSVRNQNFRVSILGEVARPSLFVIPNDQITILEALSLAGDITIYGRRTNVLIVRESSGKKEFARVDLTRRDLFQSPYYYLHPNDVIYVEPGKARVASTDRTLQTIPIALSALSFLTILITQLTLRR